MFPSRRTWPARTPGAFIPRWKLSMFPAPPEKVSIAGWNGCKRARSGRKRNCKPYTRKFRFRVFEGTRVLRCAGKAVRFFILSGLYRTTEKFWRTLLVGAPCFSRGEWDFSPAEKKSILKWVLATAFRFPALKHFHTWCIGWSTASAVQLGFGNETALAAEVTETLPQALKRDPRIDGSYARLKACSTHRLYTRCYREPRFLLFGDFVWLRETPQGLRGLCRREWPA